MLKNRLNDRPVKLNPWQMCAIEQALKEAIASGSIEPRSGNSLLRLISDATSIKVQS